MFSIIILTLVTGLFLVQNYKNTINDEIMSYLVNDIGYEENEIYKISTHIGKAPLVSTTVIFNDERDSRYFYREENGGILQYNAAPLHGVDDGRYHYKHKLRISKNY